MGNSSGPILGCSPRDSLIGAKLKKKLAAKTLSLQAFPAICLKSLKFF